MDESPHVGHSVASLGYEHLWRLPSLSLQAADVGSLQGAQYLAVLGRAEHGDGRCGDGGVGVDEVGHVVGVGDAVVAFLRGEADEVLAVEPYFIIMYEVGVLLLGGTLAAVAGAESRLAVGREVDDALLLVDMLDATHVVLAASDLPDELSLLAVVEVDVMIAVALAGPEDALSVLEVTALLAVVVDVLVVALLDERAHLSRHGRELEHAVGVVPSLVELEGDGLAVLVPSRHAHLILMLEKLRRRLDDPACGHLDDDGHAEVERVAGLGILLLVKHGLHGIPGRRLDIVDIMLGSRLDAHGGIVASVGRERAPGRVVERGVAVGGQLACVLTLPGPEVVVANEDSHPLVGRLPRAVHLVGHLCPVSLLSAASGPLPLLLPLGILRQQRDGVLVGIDLLVDLFLAIEDGVPELVLVAHGVYADVAEGHLVGVLAADGGCALIVGHRALCQRRCQRQQHRDRSQNSLFVHQLVRLV